jgi:hypothetical protein
MPQGFKYPLLFRPNEEIRGTFGPEHEDYYLLSEDISGGVCVTVMQLIKGQGRRDICSIRSQSFQGAIDRAYEEYKKDVGIE